MSTATETKPATPPTPEPPVLFTKPDVLEPKPIKAKDFQSEGGLFGNRHFVCIDPEIYNDLLDPKLASKYLCNIENKIVSYDRVEIRASDNTFVAEWVVAELVQRSFVRFVELWRVELSKVPTVVPKATGEFQVVFLGGNRHWGVVHPNGTIVRDGLLNKANAEHEVYVRKQGSPINTMAGR
jgi:hypothetical protein